MSNITTNKITIICKVVIIKNCWDTIEAQEDVLSITTKSSEIIKMIPIASFTISKH